MQVFISYRGRHDPSRALAQRLHAALTARGHACFWDRAVLVGGDPWPEVLKRELATCDALVVLLDPAVAESVHVPEEVERALGRPGAPPRVIPVRDGRPFDAGWRLEAHLRDLTRVPWDPDDPDAALTGVLQALPPAATPATPASGALLRHVRYPARAEPPDSPLYVHRGRVEREVLRNVVLPPDQLPTLVRISGPRKTGKTTLLRRCAAAWDAAGVRHLTVNLLGAEDLSDPRTVLQYVCRRVARQMERDVGVHDHWDQHARQGLDDAEICMTFFEDHVLAHHAGPLALAWDDLDAVFFDEGVYRVVARMLRTWFNDGAEASSPWSRVITVLLYAKDAAWRLADDESPFSIGQALALEGFDAAQVAALAEAHGLPAEGWGGLSEYVGGHPWLLRLAMYRLAVQRAEDDRYDHAAALAALVHDAPDPAGPFDAHLRAVRSTLQRVPDLPARLAALAQGASVRLDPREVFLAESAGVLVRTATGHALRCRLDADHLARLVGRTP